MPKFALEIDSHRAIVRLGAIGPNVRAALAAAIGPKVAEVLADARSRAAAHIRYLGGDPGAYVDGIVGGVTTKGDKITGYIRSDKPTVHFKGRDVPLAVLMEYGATVPAHDIAASVAQVLHFTGSAGEVFARAVHSPGATIPPYPAIFPAFLAAKGGIEQALTGAVKGGAAKE